MLDIEDMGNNKTAAGDHLKDMKQSLHSVLLRLLSALFSLSSQAAICRFYMVLTPQGPSQGFSPSPKHGALFSRRVCTGPFLDSCLSFKVWKVKLVLTFALSLFLTSYCLKLSILVLPCAPLPVPRSFILYLYLYQRIKTNYNSRWTTIASHPFP